MVKINKVTTKTGDKGETGLFGTGRIRKDSIRMEAIGSVDELTALLGMLRSLDGIEEIQDSTKILSKIQNDLFDLGSELAAAGIKSPCPISKKNIIFLEQATKKFNAKLPALTSFVLPGGSVLNAWIHLARTASRRAERSVVKFAGEAPISPLLQIYLNRLSDLLFVLARNASKNQKTPELTWKPGGT